jgi:hypothetical protein
MTILPVVVLGLFVCMCIQTMAIKNLIATCNELMRTDAALGVSASCALEHSKIVAQFVGLRTTEAGNITVPFPSKKH